MTNAIPPPSYYRLAIKVAKPLYRLLLAKKQAKLPHYQREINERFGHAYLPIRQTDRGVIWCHAVSLGELNTAYPLLKRLLEAGFGLWVTSTTQTGFARANELFKDELGNQVQHSFVPVDDVAVVGRFLAHVRPIMAVFIETELWANTLYLLSKQGIPSVMANARLTPKSFASYAKFTALSHSMMNNLSYIIAQDEQSGANFIALGADGAKVGRAYSLKWCSQSPHANLPIHQEVNTWQIGTRPIWVMASTHKGEEVLALTVHQKLLDDYPNALLILVPRHPERFDEVAGLCADVVCHRRSQNQPIQDSTQVYLADSMGELLAWYGLSQVAVVGGSFVDKGGHNPIEPASLARPIIMGQYVKNCTELVTDLKAVGAMTQVSDEQDSEGLYQAVKGWFDEPHRAKQAGEQGQQLVTERAGADKVQFDMLMRLL